ncbi:TenA family protein [Loktanella agnita]|uniref:TenA family protein n=1 Tax=Loktanella agnita TaxID=287097 RepID=UPI0039888920
MTFTDQLWAETASLQTQIQRMPFNAELTTGTLPHETFQGYIIQDAHYLEGFARALSLAAARAPDADTIAQLAGSAGGAVAVERQLHSDYMARFGVSPESFAATPKSQACDHYVNFLLKSCALDPFPVAVTALLPCFWVYREVGKLIHDRAVPDHPYRAWIDTYAGEAFSASVDRMLDLTNRLAAKADGNMQAQMRATFERSSWHEWHFWDSAYRRAGWRTA